MEWTKCSECLPTKDGAYLVFGAGRAYRCVFLFGEWHKESRQGGKPTHWMELPPDPII